MRRWGKVVFIYTALFTWRGKLNVLFIKLKRGKESQMSDNLFIWMKVLLQGEITDFSYYSMIWRVSFSINLQYMLACFWYLSCCHNFLSPELLWDPSIMDKMIYGWSCGVHRHLVFQNSTATKCRPSNSNLHVVIHPIDGRLSALLVGYYQMKLSPSLTLPASLSFSLSCLLYPPDWTSSSSSSSYKCEWVGGCIYCDTVTPLMFPQHNSLTFYKPAVHLYWILEKRIKYPSIRLSCNTCSVAGILPQKSKKLLASWYQVNKSLEQRGGCKCWCFWKGCGAFPVIKASWRVFDKDRRVSIAVHLSDVGT